MSAQVFVIGTGRCGSTMVSHIIRRHPEITSISEFFTFITDLGCEIGQSFPEGEVDGEWLWRRIATPLSRQNLMLRHDVAMGEVIYPWREGTHRFNRHTGVPAISQVALPHLTDDPDGWLEALEPVVRAYPLAPLGVQFRRLFGWLQERAGGSVWVERSGGSLRIVHRLREHFPEARFVHIVRDGRDTAISMSQHRGFKMVLAYFQLVETLGCDPFLSNNRRWEEDLPDDLAALLPERFTRQAFIEFQTPAPLCAHYWSGEIREGLAVLHSLPPERLLTLRYEDFLQTPEETIRSLIKYIRQADTPEDDAFARSAARLVERPASRWQELSERERQQLELACKPGVEALAKLGLRWLGMGQG
jgi:hypothetical protein